MIIYEGYPVTSGHDYYNPPNPPTNGDVGKVEIPLDFNGRYTIGDITGNGQADFVVSARDKIAAYTLSGKQLWSKDGVSLNWDLYPVGSPYNERAHSYWNWSSYGWVDTLNGRPCFLHFENDWHTLVVRDGKTGDVITKKVVGTGRWQYVLVGKTKDGGERIFVARAPGNLSVKAFRFDGSNLNEEWNQAQGVITAYYAPPHVADLTGDGEDDIIHSTLALKGDGSLLWKKDFRNHSPAGIHTLQVRKYKPNYPGLQASYSIYGPRSNSSSIVMVDKDGNETHNFHNNKHPHQHTAGKYPDMRVLARNNDGKSHWTVDRNGKSQGISRRDPSQLDSRWGREWGHEPTEMVYNIDWTGGGDDEVLYVERHINFNTVGMLAVWATDNRFLTRAFHGGIDVPRKDPDPCLRYLSGCGWYGWQHRRDSERDGPYEGGAHVADVMGRGSEQVIAMAPNKLMIYYNPLHRGRSKWDDHSYRTRKKLWTQVYNPR